jgi:hypothetical protein
MYVFTTYTRHLSVQAHYSRSCPIISSSCYSSGLVTWTFLWPTAANFKIFIFPVSGFALSNVANISTFYGFIWLLLIACIILLYLTERSHVSFLYNFGKDRIEIATSKISPIVVCLFVAAETCLASRCLAMDVSAVLFWMHTSSIQTSCHNIYRHMDIFLFVIYTLQPSLCYTLLKTFLSCLHAYV